MFSNTWRVSQRTISVASKPLTKPTHIISTPKEWAIGITCRIGIPSGISAMPAICCDDHRMLSWVSMTPLGRPVVPEV